MKQTSPRRWRGLALRALPALCALINYTARAEGLESLYPFPPLNAVISLNGDGKLVRWHCSTTQLQVDAQPAIPVQAVRALFNRSPDQPEKALAQEPLTLPSGDLASRHIIVRVPAHALDCGNERMESDLKNAIRAEAFPDIQFVFTRLAGISESQGTKHDALVLHCEGRLSLAGQTRSVVIDVSTRLQGNALHLVGLYPLDMTDFGVTPPSALFGLIQADRRVMIDFDIQVSLDQEIGHIPRPGTDLQP